MIIKKIINRIKRTMIAPIKSHFHRIKHTRIVLLKAEQTSHPCIFYFGVPMHSNLGDLAQCICIRKFLKENYPNYQVIEIDTLVYMSEKSELKNSLKSFIKKNDLIFFQSGYCTQDLGGIEDLMHQAVIKDYPNNKLIILPQTVFFKSEERKKLASKVYNSHKNLLFLARDHISYKMAKEMFPDIKVKEFPDIVTTMIGYYHFQEEKNGILLCLRNDIEKFYSNEEISLLKHQIEKYGVINEIDTTIKKSLNAESENVDEYILSYIQNFAKYKVIITDRYHGTIFSLIANTPVIVIKTTDHKVSTGVDWFKGIYDDNVFYIENLDNVPKKVKELMSRKKFIENKPYFKENYYDKLPSVINQK